MNPKSNPSSRDRLNRAILVVCLLLIIGLLWRNGVFTKAYWQDFALSFHKNFIVKSRWKWLVSGLKNSLIMTSLAAMIGVAIGLVLSMIRVMHKAGLPVSALNAIAQTYITVIRGTPVVVQILIIYFIIFGSVQNANKLLVASLSFGINSGAYVAEIFRAGIESIDIGQMEAGRSLGLGYLTTMRKIILPQAVKNVLPTLFNEFIILLKETSIAGYIAQNDLTRQAQNISAQTFDFKQPLFAVALIYLALVLGLTFILRKLERRLARSDRR